LLLLAAILPLWITRPMVRFFKTRAHILLTNVPGPASPIDFAGERNTMRRLSAAGKLVLQSDPLSSHFCAYADRRVMAYHGFVPQPHPGGLGLALLSYDGKLSLSVLCDAGHLQPSPDAFLAICCVEFARLMEAALHLPPTPTAPVDGHYHAD